MIRRFLEWLEIVGNGEWSVYSVTDPRWNKRGRFYGRSILNAETKINSHVEKMKEKLGDPPDDLTEFAMKD